MTSIVTGMWEEKMPQRGLVIPSNHRGSAPWFTRWIISETALLRCDELRSLPFQLPLAHNISRTFRPSMAFSLLRYRNRIKRRPKCTEYTVECPHSIFGLSAADPPFTIDTAETRSLALIMRWLLIWNVVQGQAVVDQPFQSVFLNHMPILQLLDH